MKKNISLNLEQKNSFFQFLNSIKERKSYKILLQNINLSSYVQKQLENYPDFEEQLKIDWLYFFRNNFTHKSQNTRLALDLEQFRIGYELNNQTFDIYVKPIELIENVLNCVKDGIELRLNQLGISLI